MAIEFDANKDVRMRGFPGRSDVDAVLKLVHQFAHQLPAESVAVQESVGRVLTADIVARVSVPGFARSAMDGYALKGEETFGASSYNPLKFRVIGDSMPGRSFRGEIGSGESVRIMTGAPLPFGADTVVMAEYATETHGAAGIEVAVTEPFPPGRHVGQVGEDILQGDVVLRRGRLLRPQDVGVLSSIGEARVPVVRRPIVRLIITGDELLPPGSVPTGVQIVDSNSPMLTALVRRDGGEPINRAIVRDNRDLVQKAITDPEGDILLVSGGSSVGAEDHAPQVVAECGELLIHGVAMRPSSPAGMGRVHDRLIFLLPGNPVSCLAAYEFFAGPAIRLLGGRSAEWPHRTRRGKLTAKISSAVGRVDYVRVRITPNGVEPISISGASILSSTTRADGFVIVPRDSEGHPAGADVEVYLYD